MMKPRCTHPVAAAIIKIRNRESEKFSENKKGRDSGAEEDSEKIVKY